MLTTHKNPPKTSQRHVEFRRTFSSSRPFSPWKSACSSRPPWLQRTRQKQRLARRRAEQGRETERENLRQGSPGFACLLLPGPPNPNPPPQCPNSPFPGPHSHCFACHLGAFRPPWIMDLTVLFTPSWKKHRAHCKLSKPSHALYVCMYVCM